MTSYGYRTAPAIKGYIAIVSKIDWSRGEPNMVGFAHREWLPSKSAAYRYAKKTAEALARRSGTNAHPYLKPVQ